jgi:S-formylglutathione hydrolase
LSASIERATDCGKTGGKTIMRDGWTTIEIAGKPADVFDPPSVPVRFGVLFLHGYGLETLHDRPAFADSLRSLGMACICPHGRHSWWADRICAEFDRQITAEQYLMQHVLSSFNERWNLTPPAIGIYGISMGGQGALRLAFKHPQTFPVVAAISPAVDYHQLYGQGSTLDAMYDSKEQCRQDTAPMHIPPTNYPPHIFFCIDPDDEHWHRGADRLHEKLTALGVLHESDLTTRHGGHSWDYFNHMADRAQRFMHDALVHESRRLL